MTPRIIVVLILPNGVERGGDFARVALNGMALELVLKWPELLVDLNTMHKKWLMDPTLHQEIYHSEYERFAESMKSFRDRSSDGIESKPLIDLPFRAQSFTLDRHNMTWRDESTRLVYIRFKAAHKQIATTGDKEGFDVL